MLLLLKSNIHEYGDLLILETFKRLAIYIFLVFLANVRRVHHVFVNKYLMKQSEAKRIREHLT